MFDRKAHWQNIYQDKSALEVSWFQQEPVLSLAFIQDTKIAMHEAIIDVGGGASVLVDYLCKAGFSHLTVLDISENALLSAQQRLGDLANNISWLEADITQFKPPHPFSLWHDRAVFHFLTQPADRQQYVNILKQALRSGGQLVMAAFAIGGPQKCSGLQMVQYDAAKLSAELGSDFELINEKQELHITPANGEQAFAYFHFVRR